MSKRGLTPEEFNRFLNQKLPDDKIELFYRANYVNPLRVELFRDFIISLLDVIHDTYPGDDVNSEGYFFNHFKFCVEKVVKNFEAEKLYFNGDFQGVNDYFYLTLEETYYRDPEKSKAVSTLKSVYEKIFDMENLNKTQSDMEIFLDIYKSFIRLFNKQINETVTNSNK